MESRFYIHKMFTDTIWLSLIVTILKGLLQPEYNALLLNDTGIVPVVFVHLVSIVLPVALAYCLYLVLKKRARLTLIAACLALYSFPAGLALYQGLHIDCGCYMPGSLEFDVYSELKPLFVFQSLLIVAVLVLHLFNSKSKRVQTLSEGAGNYYKN